MKKRILALALAALLCLGLLVGCGNNTAQPTGSTEPKPVSISQQAIDSGNIQYYFMTNDGAFVSTDKYYTRWGDSCLIVFPDGKTMLIDTGLEDFYPILKEKLTELQVTAIDYMVFSHPHSDHCGGAWTELFEDFTIGHVYHNGAKNLNWKDSSHIEAVCQQHSIPCTAWKAGDTMQFGNADNPVKMQVLWPTAEAAAELEDIQTTPSINNLSLVMRFDYGEHSSLFTGDIYQTNHAKTGEEQVPGYAGTEEQLVSMYEGGELDVDLLKLPHHGNPITSNSQGFLNAVSPQYAVATSFEPVAPYLSYYTQRGMKCAVFFDRMYGNIHIQAGADGKITCQTSRATYPEGFTADWSENEKVK